MSAMTESAERLEPCPFCGHAEIDPCEWMDNKGNQGPGCPQCGALADSVATWNRRAPAEAGTPDGWRLVPVEPTDEMQAAAAQAIRFDTTLVNKLWTGNAVLRAGIAAAPAAPKEEKKCWCRTCRPITMADMRMVLCPTCGNKRCPKASDHRHTCHGSNEPGQPGSAHPKLRAKT